jgi:hypothetical protein
MSSGLKKLDPVMLPPGCPRLVTTPVARASPVTSMTIGIVEVACWAAMTRNPDVIMTSTLPRTSSAASSGSRSTLPSANRDSMMNVLTLDVAEITEARSK